jgi:hypothetical protein
MRQVFTSPRLENVEGVANLLREHGIETYVSGRRSYKGSRRQPFSYREQHGEVQPGVWIVKAEDQTRARELLREAGLIDSTRTDSFLPEPYQPQAPPAPGPGAVATRVKLVLLAAIVMFVLMIVLRILR